MRSNLSKNWRMPHLERFQCNRVPRCHIQSQFHRSQRIGLNCETNAEWPTNERWIEIPSTVAIGVRLFFFSRYWHVVETSSWFDPIWLRLSYLATTTPFPCIVKLLHSLNTQLERNYRSKHFDFLRLSFSCCHYYYYIVAKCETASCVSFSWKICYKHLLTIEG